jgi:hypothetical protein
MTLRSRLLVVCAAGWLSGCAARTPPAVVPPPPPPVPSPSPSPVVAEPPRPAQTPVVEDPIAQLIKRADAEFDLGRAEFDKGRLVSAREHFDAAIDMLLKMPAGARSDARSQAAYERLLDRITAFDVLSIREADGVAEARTEPAAIDVLLSAATIERPSPKATTAETVAFDLEQTHHDIPIEANARVLSYIELFQGRLRDFMQNGLDRAQRYLPMIQAVFKAEGIPLDLGI